MIRRTHPGVFELHLGPTGMRRREVRLAAAYALVDDTDRVQLVELWDAMATQQIIRTWGPRAVPDESMRLPSEEELAALAVERELEIERGKAQVAETKRVNAERIAAAHQRYEEMRRFYDEQLEQRRKYGLSPEGREKYGFEPDPDHCRHCGGSLRGGRCHLCGAPV